MFFAKFHNCSAIYGWLIISFVKKIQSGCCRYHELLFDNSGPPTKSPSRPELSVKISYQSNPVTTFRAMVIWKFCTFGLKRLFPPQKFTFWGDFDPQTLFFLKITNFSGFTPVRRLLCTKRPRKFVQTCFAQKQQFIDATTFSMIFVADV